jgi:pimeloyl-ACP methyl ester carboxylesterase
VAVHDRLNVVAAGEGPPVVLLHGLTATHRYVVMGSTHLERHGHRVIAYDARGHGASEPAPDAVSYTYAELLADLLELLDDEGIDRAVLAGASMGAHTAVKAALEHPDRVAGLVVVTPAYDPVRQEDAGRLERWDALSEGLRTGGVDGFVAAYDLDAVPEAWRETVERVLRQRLALHEHPDAVADALRAVPRSRPFTAFHELAGIGAPTVVVGDRDEADAEHPLAVAEDYARIIPGAELVVEEEGRSPIAWQGSQLSRVIEELAARAAWS